MNDHRSVEGRRTLVQYICWRRASTRELYLSHLLLLYAQEVGNSIRVSIEQGEEKENNLKYFTVLMLQVSFSYDTPSPPRFYISCAARCDAMRRNTMPVRSDYTVPQGLPHAAA